MLYLYNDEDNVQNVMSALGGWSVDYVSKSSRGRLERRLSAV